jgi:hypothetical protein
LLWKEWWYTKIKWVTHVSDTFIAKHGKIKVSLQMFTDKDNNLAHIVRVVTNTEKPTWKLNY